ncbi:metal cation transporter [Natronolimnobius sp. AArcel1]|uniref:ZIP family metal transporter n=1 Tax=Natronolimnobius sp. AArcel1 TaxID=1679093 RepID=UPI0013EDB16F|nr:metal cation transporter [Natronolimnobius sp. AArcel1]NGM69415.1 metal cation transporter [Natronolimnobius sp. AArcel1]
MADQWLDRIPRWLLALGPVAILAVVFTLLYYVTPFDALAAGDASTAEILLMLTVIGAIAGIIPVAIGMLWFPFIRDLDARYLHAFMALAGGVLAFIAFEMTEDALEHAVDSQHTTAALGLVVVGIGATFAVMYGASRWRQRTMAATEKSGLEVAYLVALALGLHSIGEGLGIGTYFVLDEPVQVLLLMLAFIMHNVMEGPTVVAAVARDHETPPLRHFAAMGAIAGGPVILGGWIGSFAQSNLLAALFFAIAIGAILQVLIEVADLIRFDAEAVLTRINAATFAVGFALMFILEDVLTEIILEGWLFPA